MLMISFLSECVLLEQCIVGVSDQASNVGPFEKSSYFKSFFRPDDRAPQ